MTSRPAGTAAAYLAETAELIAERDARWDGGPILHGDDTDAFNAIQDKLAARAPVLAAALEAVLARHQPATEKANVICEGHGGPEGLRRLGEAAYRAEIAACPDCQRKDLTVCAHCACPYDAWPCPTYRDIEAALTGTQGGTPE